RLVGRNGTEQLIRFVDGQLPLRQQIENPPTVVTHSFTLAGPHPRIFISFSLGLTPSAIFATCSAPPRLPLPSSHPSRGARAARRRPSDRRGGPVGFRRSRARAAPRRRKQPRQCDSNDS